jgi:hypothetical protein
MPVNPSTTFRVRAQKMHAATLPGRLGRHLGDGVSQARMIGGDDELDAAQAAAFQTGQKLLLARGRFPVRQLHTQDLPAAVVVDPDRHQHRL